MRRWQALVEGYVAECEVRGLAEATLVQRRAELERFGSWLRRRRPRPGLEAVDGPLVVAYERSRMAFRARATVAGVVSDLRGMGEFLVRDARQLWTTVLAVLYGTGLRRGEVERLELVRADRGG